MNIVSEIRKRGHGELIAIREKDRTISFNQLFEAVDAARSQLAIQPGFSEKNVPRVGVIFPNGAAYIVVALAVLEAGACFVPIPDELTATERNELIVTTALDYVIHAAESGFSLPLNLGHVIFEKLTHPTLHFPVADFEKLNPAFIRFSSGTTGSSKGVVLSHESLLARILAANDALKLSPADKVLWTLPMAHHFAVTIILYLYHGVTTVLETSNRPDLLFQAALDSQTNLLYGSPFHFAQLAQYQLAHPLPDLRMAISTASALTTDIANAFEKRFFLPITQALGIIEIGLPIMNLERAADLPTALGKPLPAYEIKTTQKGELLIRGKGMFDAYLVPWQPRNEVTSDGWFATGDLVELLPDGTVIMHGRSKSVINIGGMKVFPEEIEAVLNSHPAIAKSKVFAEKHPTLGSFPCAELLLETAHPMPSPRELRSHCLEKLAGYKLPMRYLAVNSIATTASGKVKRH